MGLAKLDGVARGERLVTVVQVQTEIPGCKPLRHISPEQDEPSDQEDDRQHSKRNRDPTKCHEVPADLLENATFPYRI
jgi:hypothetical protein